MKFKTLGATASVAALIALSAAVPATAGNSSAVGLEDMLPVLAVPQDDTDRMPHGIDLADLGGVSKDSVRAIGSDEAARYWVGRSGTSEVCLILQVAADSEMAASTCAPITEFYRNGLRLVAGKSADDPSSSAEAYLLPADIDLAAIGAPEARATARSVASSPNLVSGRPDQLEDLERVEVRREDGSTFYFNPISFEGK